MNFQLKWLKQFKNYVYQLPKILAHIWFLETCLSLGLTPKGLYRPTQSGLPNYMKQPIELLFKTQIKETIKNMINLYREEEFRVRQGLASTLSLLQETCPQFLPDINRTIINANNLLQDLKNAKLLKLSTLCMNELRTTGYIELQISLPRPSLIGDKPSLASLLNLPIPTGQKPVLPKPFTPPTKQVQPNNKPNDKPSCNVQICNISSYELTESEKSVLEKGLKFTPTAKIDHFNLVSDVLTFGRRLKIEFFKKTNPDAFKSYSELDSALAKFKPPSSWDPPPLPPDHPLELYLNFILQKISDPTYIDKLPKTNNLTKEERAAIRSLDSNDKILVLPADKGSLTVVMNTDDYVEEANKQLSDTSVYKELDSDPTHIYNQQLKDFINREHVFQDISPQNLKLLINENPRTAQFYLLPKIHKDILPPPGRPIVSGCNSHTERISAFVDSHLQPWVRLLPSHIKDTSDFLNHLASLPSPLPANSILATVDVTSLYTNIPHAHGLSAVEHFLDKRPKNSKPTTSFLLNLIKFILEHNNFQFMDRNFLQLKGTAMGTKMAPSYANLYMGRIEETFLQKQIHQPLCWFRFIDDIFLIWTHGQDNLQTFLNSLQNHSNLKFTWNFSTEMVTFLDVNVSVKNGMISTSIHIKPTNKQQFLHFESCHPNNTKRAIPYSQALRAKRIFTEKQDMSHFNQQMEDAFVARGYPRKLVQNQIHRAQATNSTKSAPERSSNDISLITTFHHGLQNLNKILNDGFLILQASPHTKDLLSKPPTVLFRQLPNLEQKLVKPKQLGKPQKIHSEPTGSFPCNRPTCKTCSIHPPSESFKSSITNREYKIPGHYTCSSSNLIYQLQCNLCSAQYVGLTTETLRKRMNGHRHDCKSENSEKPVSKHTIDHGLSFEDCYTIKVIRSFPENCNSSQLRRWELAHQWVTKSRDPPNLNIR